MPDLTVYDPTTAIDLDFGRYVEKRQDDLATRQTRGVPDYAFPLDAQLRRQLAALLPIRIAAQALLSGIVPVERQMLQMDGVAVGPNQFPEVHAMGVDCARILGIGIPQIFVKFDPQPNAGTYCTGQVDQIVFLTSSLVQACDSAELKSVIGHECGHIHNQHVVYNTMWEIITNPLAGTLLDTISQTIPGVGPALLETVRTVLRLSTGYLLGRWSRCAEFTCDRAGLICCGDPAAALRVQGKLLTGGASQLKGFSPDEFARQIGKINELPVRFLEIMDSHPLGPKRVKAMELFATCETLYRWRPELRAGLPADTRLRSQTEVDAECEKLVL